MNDMMSMDSMMLGMMAFSVLGWLAVIGLLIAIVVLLVRLLHKTTAGGAGEIERQRRYEKPLQ